MRVRLGPTSRERHGAFAAFRTMGAFRAIAMIALVLLVTLPRPARAAGPTGAPAPAAAPGPGRGMRDACELAPGEWSLDRWLAAVAAADSAFERLDPQQPEEPASMGAPMRAVYDGLQYFLSGSLRAAFAGLSSDALRTEFVRRYWALRDPTPTTPENERRDEHERRVEYARSNFAMPHRPYWDARGEFYIRFGAPAAIYDEPGHVRVGLGYVPRRETWMYPGTDLEVSFEQGTPGLPYALGNSSAKQTNRRDLFHEAIVGGEAMRAPELRNDDDRVAMHEVAPDAQVPVLEPWTAGSGAILAENVTHTTAEMFRSAALPQRFLPAVFDCDAFRADSVRTRIEAHLQFNLRDLQFTPKDSLWAARVRVQGVLFDANLHEVARDSYEETIPVRSHATTTSATLWPAQLAFEVPAGEYRLALRVLDTYDGGAGDFAVDLRVPRFGSGHLVLSDLEMATAVETRSSLEESRFAKGAQVVMPNPSAAYARGAPVVAYFEVYGLRPDARGERRYALAYRIQPVEAPPSRWWPWKGGTQAPAVESRVVVNGRDEEPAEALRIDVSTLAPGAYRLEVVLRDEQTQAESTAGSDFRIVEPQP